MENLSFMANLTIAFGCISLLSLLTLHFVSSEFKPSFRMISEYALGKHRRLLTIFFFCWGLCSISSGIILWNVVTTGWAQFGVILFFISGMGAIMGGLFDVQHKLHGLSFGLGVPFYPIGVLLVTYHLLEKSEWQNYTIAMLFSSHSIWISLILMGTALLLFFSNLKSAGVEFGSNSAPITELPKGVTGIHGWLNRFLVLCYILYPILTAKILLTILYMGN